jgi:uncharacterized membrane protein YphA (DoxX/SURF4 family)
VVALVLLRITIGWHFLFQGLAKLEDPEFSSAGFLSQCKGPLGDYFRNLMPDPMGAERLKAENQPQFAARIDDYLARFKTKYKPSLEQLAGADQLAGACKVQIEQWLAENREAIVDYLHELDRLDASKASKPFPTMPEGVKSADDRVVVAPSVPSQQRRIWEKQSELQGQANRWFAELERIERDFQRLLDSLLEADQRAQGRLDHPLTEIEQIDRVVSYGVTAIGLCLMVGLLTRFSCFAGGLFLLSIVLAQPDWPGLYPPPHPSVGRALVVNKEFVEMMALFALGTTHVGRWGGLDFIMHYWILRPLFGRRETS